MTDTYLELSATDAELTEIARAALWGLWERRSRGRTNLELVRRYARGKAGIPDVAEGANEELKALARVSIINMCGVVVDTFDAGLSVVGFRSPTTTDDEPAWQLWQENGMDARQSEVHREVQELGEGYVSVLPDDDRDGRPSFATWSRLDVVADYDDERRDLFPRAALLVRRVSDPEMGSGWSVLMVDDTHVTPGFIPQRKGKVGLHDVEVGEPWPHGAVHDGKAVCPVVRFVNERPAEGEVARGEVEPLQDLQRSLNIVNFDRLVVAHYGAFRQKVIIGWTSTRDMVARLSSATTLTFDDHPDDVKVTDLPGSDVRQYNDLINELKEQVALQAAIPLYTATGNISNVSTDTAAMVESAHQRKLARKREILGESWELVLRLGVTMAGGEQPDVAAEVVWRETQARAFGAVVDGIVKLAQIPSDNAGVLVELLDLIPGMTQQKIDALQAAVTRQQGAQVLAAMQALTVVARDGDA